MIKRLELKAVHTTVDDNLRTYVLKKIGQLDKYISRHNRESAHAEIQLKETNSKSNNYACDVTLHLPHETITVHENKSNMYAAIDVVETKLKQKIKQYKESRNDGKARRHMWARFNRHAV
ncbi:MAG TPA: ribosome-associated translation inhibitor RaiA [Candidatus Saccharimonadales bacterium]|nr:ribosome-associated translation inhibitor RaiA [Candidatus Saccharimonadales bacterium]